MAESVGTFDKLAISADDSSYTALEFLPGSTLGLTETFLDPSGIRGTREHQSERVRAGTGQVNGTLLFNPTPAELDLLLPMIMGGTKAVNDIPFAETLPARYFKAGRDGTWHKYAGCKVAQAVFSAAEGSLLQLALTLVGQDESTTTDPSVSIADDSPYVMMDAADVSIGGTTYDFRSVQITVDTGLEVRFNNSTRPTSIHATDHVVTFTCGLPYGDASALYGTAVAGVAVALTFTNGAKSLGFSMAKVSAPRQPLELGNRAARTLTWTGVARKSGSTASLVITNDSTA